MRRVLYSSLLIGLVAVALVSAAGATSRAAATGYSYVALGDSFSSGEGVAPYLGNACHRASRAYSTWVSRFRNAKPLYTIASGAAKPPNRGGAHTYGSRANVRSGGGVSWASWACSGATTANVLPASAGGVPQGAPSDTRTQLDSAALGGANLVTLTLGGNDVGFVESLISCAVGNCHTTSFERGRNAAIDATKPKLEAVYRAIAARAPKARIVVLGYPQLFPASPARQACAGLRPFAGEQTMLRRIGVHLNATVGAAVASVARSGVKIVYVPVAGRFVGHEVCGAKAPWINGIGSFPTPSATGAVPFHPNLAGQLGYAAAVQAAIR